MNQRVRSTWTSSSATASRACASAFPNTDALLGGPADDRTLAGPVTIAVSLRSQTTLPCGLANTTCDAQAAALGLVACVDDLFARDGTCEPNLDPTFTHFTALPPPSDYQATCFAESAAVHRGADETRVTLDRTATCSSRSTGRASS